jgi:dTDP-4-amino-4,6-dideoxygalactose transaminase
LKPFFNIAIGGCKGRANQLCTAMARVQLKYYDERIAEIDKAMSYFCDLLEDIPGLKAIRPPKGSGITKGGWYAAKGVCSEELHAKVTCKRFCEAVSAEGADTAAGCNPPMHLHPLFHDMDYFNQGKPTVIAFKQRDLRQKRGSLPVTENFCARAFHLPWFKHFDKEAIEKHAEAFRKVAENISELQ